MITILMGGVGVVATLVNMVAFPDAFVARSVPLIATPIAVWLAVWPRLMWRMVVLEPRRRAPDGAKRVIIVGAGDSGRELVRSMLRDDRTWAPQAFVEDNPSRKHFRYLGVPVAGRVRDLLEVAHRYEATTAIIALRSLDAAGMRAIYDLAVEGGLDVKVLPSISEMIDGGITVRDVRDVEPEDLLGRRPIDTDVDAIASYLTGKRVLVTGAGGSIGSEIARQVKEYSPASLVVLDRDESALHALLLSMYGRADLESPSVVLADIRDGARLKDVFEHHRPEVVFHAAALKHVNVLEQHPLEAFKTNVLGTGNVLEAASAVGVERFVNISTDKAAAPQNVLGYTKRLAEGLTAAHTRDYGGTYLSVRFGNVLGTRGSVLTTFAAQIAAGGPVTVTHPEVTRFFMTVNEAVQLVIQAAAIGRDGEALVLDMGEPVRIIEVARRMIEHSGKDLEIEITGLKPGEKLHEILLTEGEVDSRPRHPLVSHVTVGTVEPSELAGLESLPERELTFELARACEKMSPNRRIGERSS
ncbi:polysaccharide biosynthesis protein [Aeromicrobium phragmitis]|uniref:Polysaccharide biosynthesis protein n=2 Tax=Aeromicrobium phragmitis TaxID=2478914 RepID=A0A3L8PU70_9ACTN|nr:polysaccharide biosynthesis protein [Aeromicrobium phragmitis]